MPQLIMRKDARDYMVRSGATKWGIDDAEKEAVREHIPEHASYRQNLSSLDDTHTPDLQWMKGFSGAGALYVQLYEAVVFGAQHTGVIRACAKALKQAVELFDYPSVKDCVTNMMETVSKEQAAKMAKEKANGGNGQSGGSGTTGTTSGSKAPGEDSHEQDPTGRSLSPLLCFPSSAPVRTFLAWPGQPAGPADGRAGQRPAEIEQTRTPASRTGHDLSGDSL